MCHEKLLVLDLHARADQFLVICLMHVFRGQLSRVADGLRDLIEKRVDGTLLLIQSYTLLILYHYIEMVKLPVALPSISFMLEIYVLHLCVI